MSNRAWMPLHITDYLADTGHLTAAEHGAYMLLIMHYWQKGSLPADERLIARIARMPTDQWAESRDVIAALFSDGWQHKRIEAELAKADDIIVKRKAAADARHSKSKPAADAVQVHSTSTDTGALPRTYNPSSSLRSDEVPAPAKPTPRHHLESVLDPDHAEAVIQHRQRIRKPMTERAAKMLAGDLAKFPDPNAAADRMILKGWSTIDASWPDAWPGNSPRGSPPLRMDDFLGAVIDHQERQNAGPDRKIEGPPQALRAIPGGRWTG